MHRPHAGEPDVSLTDEQQRKGFEYNFQQQPGQATGASVHGRLAAWAATTGTDWPTYTRERPGMSAFALQDDVVFHTYSAYARGLDGLWGMYQWLDRAPLGRVEDSRDAVVGQVCRASEIPIAKGLAGLRRGHEAGVRPLPSVQRSRGLAGRGCGRISPRPHPRTH
jgi:hypothetical protein